MPYKEGIIVPLYGVSAQRFCPKAGVAKKERNSYCERNGRTLTHANLHSERALSAEV